MACVYNLYVFSPSIFEFISVATRCVCGYHNNILRNYYYYTRRYMGCTYTLCLCVLHCNFIIWYYTCWCVCVCTRFARRKKKNQTYNIMILFLFLFFFLYNSCTFFFILLLLCYYYIFIMGGALNIHVSVTSRRYLYGPVREYHRNSAVYRWPTVKQRHHAVSIADRSCTTMF